ncbi:hypothetical protein ACO2Q0_02780 [Phenylobacterium sp. VNQ135]|uniref:hypothetical protein n=1 Tax=Phenylobacterium sp. VNQ135 TaxID=3400922 RepID=UPI003C0198EA
MDELDEVDRLLGVMLGEAVLAAAYRTHIRRDPAVAAGFGKLAEKHLDNVKRLAVEVAAALKP